MLRLHRGTWPPYSHFWLYTGILLPFALIACAELLSASGLDTAISRYFYDAAHHHFLISANGWLELIGHRIGKFFILTFELLLLAAAIASPYLPDLARHRRLLWTLLLAMALGPVVVTILKSINSHVCPWDLKAYGGNADYSARWFVSHIGAGRCFPGGHASSGFALIALAFAGAFLNRPRLRNAGLLLGFGVGAIFSILQVAKGAHFMSHNLWSAAIVLWAIALVFSPLMAPSFSSYPQATAITLEDQR